MHAPQPFHDFFSGVDWWTLDMHKSMLSQLAKMRMNFIGYHTCASMRAFIFVLTIDTEVCRPVQLRTGDRNR